MEDADGNVSSYISTIPAYQSNGWTLSTDARDAQLEASFEDAEKINLNVVGEYNSDSGRSVTITDGTDDPVQVAVSPGLSLDDLKHNETYPTVTSLSGTATPNSTVTVTIDGSTTKLTTTANSAGEWKTSSDAFDQDTYILGVSDSSQALTLSFVVDLSALPNTAFGFGSKELALLAGIMLVGMGIWLKYWARREDLAQ